MKLVLAKKEIEEINAALENIQGLVHYKRNYQKGYYVSNGFSQEQQEACRVLNRYEIHELVNPDISHTRNLALIQGKLQESVPLGEIIDLAIQEQWTYEELEKNFELVKSKFQEKITAEEKKLEMQKRGLTRKRLAELV